MRFRFRTATSIIVAASLCVATTQPATATNTTTPSPQSDVALSELHGESQAQDIYEALSFVDEIPDEVVENSTDEELGEYALKVASAPEHQTSGTAFRANILGCSAAIASAIAGAAFPAFKLGKIIRTVKKLGGPKATAEKIKEAGGLGKVAGQKANENNVTGMLASLAAELSGVAGIRDNCF